LEVVEVTNINIIFHSVTGHTFKLAEALGEGVSAVVGCQAHLKKIPELPGMNPVTMPGIEASVHDFSHVPEATVEDLLDCDGLAVGSAVYWGNMSYATKYFIDTAAKLYAFPSPDRPLQPAMELLGKPATVFTGGGTGLANDNAILGMWTALGFFGMSIVTVGLRVPEMSDPSRVGGGSPLGAGTFCRRPGDRPSNAEIAIARAQGRALAEASRAWAQRPSD
jgi:NAD(P)H dehydrogenase (quinone)